MVTKMEFLNGNVAFHQHPVAPSFKFLKAGGMFSVLRDGADLHMGKRLWGIKSRENAPGRIALLAEKDRSVAIADEGSRILEGVRGLLDDAEYERQRRTWNAAVEATRATRAFMRCAVAYFDDMDERRGGPQRLAQEVAAADKEVSGAFRWLCREFLNEYAAEAKVRARLTARRDVVDFVVPGGIYDDNRVDRQMHGAYAELVDGEPVRWVGNSIFPNGTMRVEFKDVPGAHVEVALSPKGAQHYALEEYVADGIRHVTIGKNGRLHPAVVSIALVKE